MIAEISTPNKVFRFDLQQPLDISIPLQNNEDNPTAWYVAPPKIEAVRTEQFTGSVAEGGSVNFRNIFFNPHGHGTHTECVGHISKEVYSVNQVLKKFFFLAEVVSIKPSQEANGDQILLDADLRKLRKHLNAEAIVLRTLPNSKDKLSRQYSDTNPPFIEAKAMDQLVKDGIKHFLIDLPSVDQEVDAGVLAAHHAFWEHPENTNLERTITELIYVDEKIPDGLYLLNLQIASFENDASPSKPVLYPLKK